MKDHEIDAAWQRLLENWGVSQPMPEVPKGPVCCCSGEFTHEGETYTAVDAGCLIHGPRSNYIGAGDERGAGINRIFSQRPRCD